MYANINHPHLRLEHPDWSQRQKQIQRLWRRISQEDRAPFLTLARENRHKQKALNAKSASRGRLNSAGLEAQKAKKAEVVAQVQQPPTQMGAATMTSYPQGDFVQGMLSGLQNAEKIIQEKNIEFR